MSLRKPPERTAAAVAARQANGRKSRGRFTNEQIRRSEEMVAKLPVRLLGLAEARVLNQEPGAAERLYRELIAPYPYLPPLLERSFQDLARLYLELEAWERIRDAQLEQRWAQNNLAQRRLIADALGDLRGTAKQFLEEGLQNLPDSPAKFRKQAECLELLAWKLNRREFDFDANLNYLYGKDLDPTNDRAHTICVRCRKLMDAKPGEEPLSEAAFQVLLDLVETEKQEVLLAYALTLGEKTMTRTDCQALLGPSHKDLWMDRRGDQLRRAIDRKLLLITRLLKMYGLTWQANPAVASAETSVEVATVTVEGLAGEAERS
jgi:hypothetical protein